MQNRKNQSTNHGDVSLCDILSNYREAELLKRLRGKGKSLKHGVKILYEYIFCITISNVEMPPKLFYLVLGSFPAFLCRKNNQCVQYFCSTFFYQG